MQCPCGGNTRPMTLVRAPWRLVSTCCTACGRHDAWRLYRDPPELLYAAGEVARRTYDRLPLQGQRERCVRAVTYRHYESSGGRFSSTTVAVILDGNPEGAAVGIEKVPGAVKVAEAVYEAYRGGCGATYEAVLPVGALVRFLSSGYGWRSNVTLHQVAQADPCADPGTIAAVELPVLENPHDPVRDAPYRRRWHGRYAA